MISYNIIIIKDSTSPDTNVSTVHNCIYIHKSLLSSSIIQYQPKSGDTLGINGTGFGHCSDQQCQSAPGKIFT